MTPPGLVRSPEEFTSTGVLTKKRAGVPPALFFFLLGRSEICVASFATPSS